MPCISSRSGKGARKSGKVLMGLVSCPTRLIIQLVVRTPYGSVSAGREKCLLNVLFFEKSKVSVAKPRDIDDFFRFAVTYHDLGMPLK